MGRRVHPRLPDARRVHRRAGLEDEDVDVCGTRHARTPQAVRRRRDGGEAAGSEAAAADPRSVQPSAEGRGLSATLEEESFGGAELGGRGHRHSLHHGQLHGRPVHVHAGTDADEHVRRRAVRAEGPRRLLRRDLLRQAAVRRHGRGRQRRHDGLRAAREQPRLLQQPGEHGRRRRPRPRSARGHRPEHRLLGLRQQRRRDDRRARDRLRGRRPARRLRHRRWEQRQPLAALWWSERWAGRGRRGRIRRR